MADEIAVAFITGKTLTADVFQPDGTEREFGVSLTETGQGLLYLGDCATITAGDLIVAMEGSIYIGAEEYLPELYNLDTRFDSLDTDMDDMLAAQRNVNSVYDDTSGNDSSATGTVPGAC
jgi:hypothetical protein